MPAMPTKLNSIFRVATVLLAGHQLALAAEKAATPPSIVSARKASRPLPNKELGWQLASSFDAGDSYPTPTGLHHLRRLSGAIALPTNGLAARQITEPGQPLAGYRPAAPLPRRFAL